MVYPLTNSPLAAPVLLNLTINNMILYVLKEAQYNPQETE